MYDIFVGSLDRYDIAAECDAAGIEYCRFITSNHHLDNDKRIDVYELSDETLVATTNGGSLWFDGSVDDFVKLLGF